MVVKEKVVLEKTRFDAPTDVEMLRMTQARDLPGLPLGCRIEMLTSSRVRCSVGMRNRATFNADEWMAMVFVVEDGKASPERLDEWLAKKALTKGEFRVWLDKDLEYKENREPRDYDVGKVLDAYGLQVTAVCTEL